MGNRAKLDRLLLTSIALFAVAVLPLINAPCQAARAEFDPMTAPTKQEWQHFHKMSEAELAKLWSFQQSRGTKRLGDWAWQWRMGWLQRCGQQSMNRICSEILLNGLKDDAMVVRAEAAARIGDRFAGKTTPALIKALSAAYKDARNTRNGSPLFVCDRILEALRKIGGKRAIAVASDLAKAYPETSEYWAKITKL